MKMFDLSVYKEHKQYFMLFDILIKNKSSNKDIYLENIGISPSSYRRSRDAGNKIGELILNQLCEHFGYSIVDENIIIEIENNINEIYYSIYYKKMMNNEKYLNWLEEMINKKLITYPIFKLFKLLIILTDNKNPNSILLENKELYVEVCKYENFYTKELKSILEIIKVSFKEDIDKYYLSQNFKNEISYYTLAVKCTMEEKYIESIYFTNIAKNYFIKEENFKRVYYCNLNLLSCYVHLGKYDDAYTLCKKQMISLESNNIYEQEYLFTQKLYIVSCTGLKKYKEVINYVDNFKKMDMTIIICYLISLFYTNKIKYNEYINENVIKSDLKESIKEKIILLDKYLKKKEAKTLTELENRNIIKTTILILKKL